MTIADPPTAPFFISGGTLTVDASSYVERQADREQQSAGGQIFAANSKLI